MTTTKQQARTAAKALRPHVDTLLLATAHAQLERERVDKVQRRVLDSMGYEKVPLRDTYTLPDAVAAAYFERLNAIHLADGFAKAAEGHCPALTAETTKTEAEWALIKAAEAFFPGTTNNRLLCAGLDKRQRYLDLLIGLVVNMPGYRSPL